MRKNTVKKLKLLPLNYLIKTGAVDRADWNYKPILGYIQRQRFKLCLKLIGNSNFKNLLEIGYGSGIFIPQLNDFCENLYGIDIHNKNEEVGKILSKLNTNTQLISSGADNIPFEDNFFDAIISISAMEFIDNLEAGCKEIKRILKKDGLLYIITPRHSKILDFGLKILTGENAEDNYGNNRERLIPTIQKHFKLEERISFPNRIFPLKLYSGLKLFPKEEN